MSRYGEDIEDDAKAAFWKEYVALCKKHQMVLFYDGYHYEYELCSYENAFDERSPYDEIDFEKQYLTRVEEEKLAEVWKAHDQEQGGEWN